MKKTKKTNDRGEEFKAKEEHLLRNGAILLEQQISCYQAKGGEPLRIFTADDIKRATNNYDPNLIFGRLLSTVYKGTLDDDHHVVAVKTPKGLNPSDDLIRYYLNQVTTKLQIHHKNLVNLLGCCLETQIPILVHEFMPNGTLYDHLYGNRDTDPRPISWKNRLKIAKDVAYGLCYMHCAGSNPIVHRDVKSSSVLLDWDFTAKLSNFGFSVQIKRGAGDSTKSSSSSAEGSPVRGSEGYIDPEYAGSGRVSEKCDVYSFGVVMMELLGLGLARELFDWNVREEEVLRVVDRGIVEDAESAEEIEAFVGVALRCLRGKGEERPSMKDVVQELGRIQSLGSLKSSREGE